MTIAQSGSIDFDEFSGLIADLHEVEVGIEKIPPRNELSKLAAKIASHFVLEGDPSVCREEIGLSDFVSAVKRTGTGAPFCPEITGSIDLRSVLLNKSGALFDLKASRTNQGLPPFIPTYEYQQVFRWQEPLSYFALDIRMLSDRNEARIPSTNLPYSLWVPSLKVYVRPPVNRYDSVRDIKQKIIDVWKWPPDMAGIHRIKPSIHELQLCHGETVLDDRLTSEQCSLFFIYKHVHVMVSSSDLPVATAPPPSCPTPHFPPNATPLLTSSNIIGIEVEDQLSVYDGIVGEISDVRHILRTTTKTCGSRLHDVLLDLPDEVTIGRSNHSDLRTVVTSLTKKVAEILKILDDPS